MRALAGLLQLLLVAWAAVYVAWPLTQRAHDGPSARLAQGLVLGKDMSEEGQEGFEFFRAIRYAHAPVGNRRFKRSVPIWHRVSTNLDPDLIEANRTGKDGAFDGTYWGPSCPQLVPAALFGGWTPPRPEGSQQPVLSEDCLRLNVARPKRIESLLPVLVFLHGGSFVSGADFAYEPWTLMSRGLKEGRPFIFVSLNYRLGAFGFLAGPHLEMLAEEGYADLNVGLHDQRIALMWVKKNIAAFGGDPNKITLAGFDAGGSSAIHHLLTGGRDTAARGGKLFHAAILMSAGPSAGMHQPSEKRHSRAYDAFAGSTICGSRFGARSQIECLRNLTSDELQIANVGAVQQILNIHEKNAWHYPTFHPYVPTIDNFFVRPSPLEQWRKGEYMDVPMIVGNVLDEGTSLAPQDLDTAEEFEAWARDVVLFADDLSQADRGAASRALAMLYPDEPARGSPFRPQQAGRSPADRFIGGESSQNQYRRAAAALGDAWFQAPRRFWLRAHAAHQSRGQTSSSVWGYLVTQPMPGDAVWGAHHGVDQDLLFKPLPPFFFSKPPSDYRKPGTRWQQVSAVMSTYWTHFIRHHDPNHGPESVGRSSKLSFWPPYSLQHDVDHRGRPSAPLSLLQLEAYNVTVISDDYRETCIAGLLTDPLLRRAFAY